MFSILRKYFIPDKQNNHKPRILRTRAILRFLFLMTILELIILSQVFFLFPKTDFLAVILPDILVDLTNTDRAANNLQSLKINPLLTEAARLKAEDMALKGYFSHNSPDGKTPWFWLDKVGYSFIAAGENLAVNFFDSKDIENAWMNSASHRANILNNKFTEIGIATANGIYQGRQTVFVVQFFGRPAQAAVSTPSFPPRATASVTKSASKTPAPKDILPELQETIAGREKNITSPFSEEMSIEIGEQEKTAMVAKKEAENIPEDTAAPAKKSFDFTSFVNRILAAPRTATNYIYFGIGLLIFIALVLKIFIRFSIQHPALILNGFFVLLIVVLFLYLNYYLFVSQAAIF